jgi:hypothetical protein
MSLGKFEFPILTPEELSAKLKPLKTTRGYMPPDGEGLTLSAIGQFLGWNHYKLYTAVQGVMSQETQVKLSRFFHRWELGQIVFTFKRRPYGKASKPGDGFGWTVHYPEYPIPRNVPKPGTFRANLKTGKLERK